MGEARFGGPGNCRHLKQEALSANCIRPGVLALDHVCGAFVARLRPASDEAVLLRRHPARITSESHRLWSAHRRACFQCGLSALALPDPYLLR